MPLVAHGLWRVVVALLLLAAVGFVSLYLGLAYALGDESELVGWLALMPFTALTTVWVIVRGRWSDEGAGVQIAFTAVAGFAGVVAGVLVGRSALGLARLHADAGVGAGDLRDRLWLLASAFAFAALVATALPSPLPRRVVLGGVGALVTLAAAGGVAAATVPGLDCRAVDAFAFRAAAGKPGALDTHSERELLARGLVRCGTLGGLPRAAVRARLGGDGRLYAVGDGLLGPTTFQLTYVGGRVNRADVEADGFD